MLLAYGGFLSDEEAGLQQEDNRVSPEAIRIAQNLDALTDPQKEAVRLIVEGLLEQSSLGG